MHRNQWLASVGITGWNGSESPAGLRRNTHRADVVGIFPNEGAIIRLIGAVLLEANDEWQLQHRYMQTEAMAELIPPTIDAIPNEIATIAA